jgi:mRNA-degrading endonuclease RelE of RelBE toxin-antitoxin system
MILDAVARQLSHEPTLPTRNRKLLRANATPPWELRIGSIRVHFEVQDTPAIVTVRAIGVKVRERVLIGGSEVDLHEDDRSG